MWFRTLLHALNALTKRTPVRQVWLRSVHRRSPACRLNIETLEDRCVPASLSVSDVSIIEGNAGTRNALVAVSLSSPSNQPVTVDYSTANGTAVAGSDYQTVSGKLTFSKGVTSKSILVPVIGNQVIESDEAFFVNLKNAKRATIANGQGVVSIVNDDTSIRIGDVWLEEGNSGTTSFTFTIDLSVAIGQPVTVNYATADGSAMAGSDYAAASGSLTISAGETSGTLTVLVNGDRLIEPDENFFVNLSNATIGTITDSQGRGYIYDDEPRIYISGAYAAEGNVGKTEFNFEVTLSYATDVPVTVDFDTTDGTATTTDSDYTAASGTLTFAPGVTSQTITILVNGDLIVEPDEDFSVNLSNPTNAQIGFGQASALIQSDDNAVLHIDSWWDLEPDPYYGGSTTFYFTVWLSAPASETVTVDFATADDSAIDGYDYLGTWGTLTFEPGQTSQTIEVSVLADWEYEWDEYFYVVLSNPSSNALIQPGWYIGVGTIFDNQGDSGW